MSGMEPWGREDRVCGRNESEETHATQYKVPWAVAWPRSLRFIFLAGTLAVGMTPQVIHSAVAGPEVIGWGDNTYGQITVPDGLSNVVAIAAGTYHSLALKADGTV